MTHGSHREPETSVLLTHSVIRWFRDHYLNGTADIHDWRASPAQRDDAGRPAAGLCADRRRRSPARRRRRICRTPEAGRRQRYRQATLPGQFHGFFTMGKLLQQANVAVSEIGAWLKGLG